MPSAVPPVSSARAASGAVVLGPVRGLAAAVALAALVLTGCATTAPVPPAPAVQIVDARATPETKALFYNLRRMARSGESILFGHQDDLAYGVTWRREAGRSDTRDAAGAYPAVYGWELGDLEHDSTDNLDGVRFDDMRRWIREGYDRGGVITVSWHMDNPTSGGSSWDTTRAIPDILPGGRHHAKFLGWLDRFAAFADGLRGPRGEHIPLIFRPYHEHTGFWFWWGRPSTNTADYVALWRFTVRYLRDTKGLRNLLYAYSPNSPGDHPNDFSRYFEFYPGDDYVDLLGFDDYATINGGYGDPDPVAAMASRLRMLVEAAEARGKIPALTETGLEGMGDLQWLARTAQAFKADPAARRIAYVLLWRNAHQDDKPGHFFSPYGGHPSAPGLAAWRADPLIVFGDEIPAPLYRFPGR